ncbi:MAG: type I secretion system permease/ATPase [Burkholderiales bacterium PBB3]|nr:MAG: type I secretion system permease/ATPase [Burkholderiales bacterium PBB3]
MKKTSFFQRSELTSVLATFQQEFWAVGVFSMVANLLMLAPTLYMLQVFDRVLVSKSELTLLALSIITFFLFCVMAFAEWMRSRVLVRAGVRLDARLSSRVFNASFDAYLNQTGGAPPRAFGDLIQVRQFLTGNGVFAFFDTPWVPIYIGVLFILHPWLGIMAIVFALIQGALAWWGYRTAAAPSEAAVKASSDVNVYLQSKLRSSEALEPMGMVGNLQGPWHTRHLNYLTENAKAQGVTQRIAAVSKFIRYVQQSLALGMGALLVIDGQLSPGAMIAANVLTTRALAPIDMMVGVWRGFISAREAFARLETLLGKYPQRDVALKRVAPKGVLSLRNVVASAPGRAAPILKNVSLDASPGTVTVILGPSGSGKSTLARVIMGIWTDVRGDVLLDGMPLQGWDRGELGPYIGYLPQDIELFEGTIAENISRFSELDSTKVIDAAKSAGLHDMILRLPKGYDTPIGEAGSLLSGGQRQRVGLARAVYGNPMLVVLDEPNANLDDVGEAALMGTIGTLKALGKTVVLITHRPGAIAAADQLVILRDGAVQMTGPREAVLEEMRVAQAIAQQKAPAIGLAPVAQA